MGNEFASITFGKGGSSKMSTESREIRSIEDFREAKKLNAGFIVITDKITGNVVHNPSCVWVKEENFIKKVISNNNENGSYYWIADKDLNKWNATSCKKRSKLA